MTAWPPPALVLTAGLGTRLRPLSAYRAKPAMPVGREALVCRILRRLADAGIRDAVLNLHHLPADDHARSRRWIAVRPARALSWEQPRVLGSAGGPRHALPLLDADTLLIVNGDTLCDLPIRALWDAHVASGALVTLGLMPHPQPGRYGGVVLDDGPAPTHAAVSRVRAAHEYRAERALPRHPDRAPLGARRPARRHAGRERARGVSAADGDACPAPSAARSSTRISTTSAPSRTTAARAARWPATPTATSSIPLATVAADARLRGCIVWPGARARRRCAARRRRRHGPRRPLDGWHAPRVRRRRRD